MDLDNEELKATRELNKNKFNNYKIFNIKRKKRIKLIEIYLNDDSSIEIEKCNNSDVANALMKSLLYMFSNNDDCDIDEINYE